MRFVVTNPLKFKTMSSIIVTRETNEGIVIKFNKYRDELIN